MKPSHLIVLLAVILGASGTALFFATHERKEVEKRTPPTGRAATDRFHAAALLLQALGVATGNEVSPLRAEVDGARLVFTIAPVRRAELVTPLLDWVEEGGHLIVSALPDETEGSQESETDPLLDALEVSIVRVKDARIAPVDGVLHADRDLRAKLSRAWELQASGETQPISFEVDGRRTVVAVRVSYGDGLVTVVLDAEAFSNGRIGEAEHARWLEELLLGWDGELPSEATFLRAGGKAPWTQRVWDGAWFVVVSAALLLAAWLWTSSRRFGPLLPAPSLERRRIVEHVRATGRYLWRLRESGLLLAAERSALRERTHAPPPSAGPREQMQWMSQLSQRSGLTIAAVANALQDDPGRDRAAFTHMMRTLQTLRKGQ